MTDYISKHKLLIIGTVLMAVFYWGMRLTNLTALPIFTDGAIYICWEEIGGRDASWRFISLPDGKQPLFVWAMMITLRLIHDPLFAGRIVSVVSGFFSMIGIGLLSWELFRKKRTAVIASFLYLVTPFTLMYDRMALMDSTLALFSIWSLYLAVILVRTGRLDAALLLGVSLGGGVLTKTSGFLTIYLLPLLFALFDFREKDWKMRLMRLMGLMGIAVAFSQIYYSILRLSPWFHMIHQKDGTFIYSVSELAGDESLFSVRGVSLLFRFFIGNTRGIFDWTVRYLTPPVAMAAIASLFLSSKLVRKGSRLLSIVLAVVASYATLLKIGMMYPAVSNAVYYVTKDTYRTLPWIFDGVFAALLISGGAIALWNRQWKKLVLFGFYMIPAAGLALFGKVLYPRFILFMTIPLLVLAAWGIDWFFKQNRSSVRRTVFVLILLALPLYTDVKILFSIVTSPIPRSDSEQYVNDWPAGWGVREAVDFLEHKSQMSDVVVYTDGTFGLMPYGIEIYLVDNPRIKIKGIWPAPELYTDEMNADIAHVPTYYVSNQRQSLPPAWRVQEIASYKKGTKNMYLRIYRLLAT